MKKALATLSVLAVLAGWAAAQQEESGAASPYFDCPYVNYFDTDCPQLSEPGPRQPVAGARTPEEKPPQEEGTAADTQEERPGVLPDELILFPRESLAPDAPPLFQLLLAVPTLDNARRYVRWHARRTAQLIRVQALIQQAGRELERDAGLLGQGGGKP